MKRGLYIYVSLVFSLASSGFVVVIPDKLGLADISHDYFAPITGPTILAYRLAHDLGMDLGNGWTAPLLVILLIGLLYYALLLSPLAIALMTTRGRLREVHHRRVWLVLQAAYLIGHGYLVYLYYAC